MLDDSQDEKLEGGGKGRATLRFALFFHSFVLVSFRSLPLCLCPPAQVQAGQAMSDAVVLPSLWAAAAAAAAEERSGDTAGDVESIFSSVDVDADGVLEVAELKEVSLFLSLSLALALSLSHSLSVSLSLPDWRSYDSHGPLCPTPGTRGRTRREDQGDRRR